MRKMNICVHARRSVHDNFPVDLDPKAYSKRNLSVMLTHQQYTRLPSLEQDQCGYGNLKFNFNTTEGPIS